MAIALSLITQEVESGLQNERPRLRSALTNISYFDGDGEQFLQPRPAENSWDFADRPKRCSQFTRRATEVLTENLYAPGPARVLENSPEVDAFYQGVATDNSLNALLYEADVAATLNDVAMVQVAATGDARRPIKLTLWDSSQFAVFCDRDDPCTPAAVVTIDRYNETSRYTLWVAGDPVVRVYRTEDLTPDSTAGGRVARPDHTFENPYGILPFAFFHYSMPTRSFWTPGPGTALRKVNYVLDWTLSNLLEANAKHLNPIGIAVNVDEAWRPILRPGEFLRLPAAVSPTTDEPTMPGEPELKYVQAEIDQEGQWHDLNNFLDHTLQGFGVPAAAVRMDQSSTASGYRVVAEQAPLLARARRRQPLWAMAETKLAAVILAVGAYSLDRADLAEAAADPKLTLIWPEPSIPLPGPDRDLNDQNELALGIASPVDVLMRRRGWTREMALAHLEQVAQDRAALARLGLAPAAPATAAPSLTERPSALADPAAALTSSPEAPETP